MLKRALIVLAVAGLCLWLAKDLLWTSTRDAQRAFELKAHERLMRTVAATSHDPSISPAPFSSDGCSGGLSTAWRSLSDRFPSLAEAHQNAPPWEQCCVTHDRAYHDAGGAKTAKDSYDARLKADEALSVCVFETRKGREVELTDRYGLTPDQIETTYAVLSKAVFDAVRIGGLPCSGLAWRWGFGYPPCREAANTR